MKRTTRILFAGILACLLAGQAVASDLAKLAENSPFLPFGWRPPPSSRPAPPQPPEQPVIQRRDLQFKGYYSLSGKFRFNVLDRKTQETEWLELNRPGDSGMVVRSFDPNAQEITLTVDNRTERLSLHQAEATTQKLEGAPPQATAKAPVASSGSVVVTSGSGSKPNIPKRRVILPGSNQNQNADSGEKKPARSAEDILKAIRERQQQQRNN